MFFLSSNDNMSKDQIIFIKLYKYLAFCISKFIIVQEKSLGKNE